MVVRISPVSRFDVNKKAHNRPLEPPKTASGVGTVQKGGRNTRRRVAKAWAKAAFEPAHGTHVNDACGGVFGMSKCSVRTSVSVHPMLLEHGVLGHEPLSLCYMYSLEY